MSVLMSLKAVAMSAAIMLPVSHAYDTGYQMNNNLVYQRNEQRLKALRAERDYLKAEKQNIIVSRILSRQRRIQQNHGTLDALQAREKYLIAQKFQQQQYRKQQRQYRNQQQQYRNQHMQLGRKPARTCNLQQARASQQHCVGEPMVGSGFGTTSVYLGRGIAEV